MDKRFEHLEGAPELPEEVKSAISRISRFGHLEIGSDPPAAAAAVPAAERVPCPHCQQLNEKPREICWACSSSLKAAAPEPAVRKEIELVYEGVLYKSGDPGLPEEIRVLMDRIEREGYSDALMKDWENWRHELKGRRLLEKPTGLPEGMQAAPSREIKILQGRWVSVITIDGKSYKSDDPVLTSELRHLFDYLEKNGVTPALRAYLEQFGHKVQISGTAYARPPEPDHWIKKEAIRQEIVIAEARLAEARSRLKGAGLRLIVPAALTFLYVIWRMSH